MPGAPATLADIDILAWKNSLGAALPAGDGAITTDAAVTGDPNIVRITIRWDDSRGLKPRCSSSPIPGCKSCDPRQS